MIEIYPSKQEISKIIVNNTDDYLISIWSELIWDLETPVSAYHKVCKDKKYSFLLESVDGGENFGRYSFIGFDPICILKADKSESSVFNPQNEATLLKHENPYQLMENLLSRFKFVSFDLPFSPGMVGYFGYDSVRHIEPKLKEMYKNIERCESFPEAYFMNAGMVIAFDNLKHKIYIINNVIANASTNIDSVYNESKSKIEHVISQLSQAHNLSPLNLGKKETKADIASNISKEEWINAVNAAKEHIKSGDVFQVVLSQRFCAERNNIAPFTMYRALRSINPSPYLYYLNYDDFQIVGSSPEMMVKCSQDRTAYLTPIAGTKKRGKSNEEDLLFEKELLDDPKERAEHIMLVDLGRNDLGRVCECGSVKVNKLMFVEKFSHVMHIVSDVRGKLRAGLSSVDLLKACFPAGTLSGAPKVKAMEVIYNLEKAARGPYGGCIGYIGFNGEVNTAITIRTMLVRDNNVFVQSGAGIVADSDPETEYLETQNKAAALIQSLARISD